MAEPHLIQPTIIYDFPLAVTPLSKKKPDEPDWVERFEFYIGGFEVGNAFSELNDPDDQRARFEQQMSEKERGDDEAHQMDEDYVRALGYGLPQLPAKASASTASPWSSPTPNPSATSSSSPSCAPKPNRPRREKANTESQQNSAQERQPRRGNRAKRVILIPWPPPRHPITS